MPKHLPATWIAHLDGGVSYRIGSCPPGGDPQLMRAVGARVRGDGSLEVLVARKPGRAVLDAIAASGHVALVAGSPYNHRTLHLKGQDARVSPADAAHQPLLESQRQAFADAVQRFGVSREDLHMLWFTLTWQDLDLVHFTLSGAWDQTPGIGAGGVIELRATSEPRLAEPERQP